MKLKLSIICFVFILFTLSTLGQIYNGKNNYQGKDKSFVTFPINWRGLLKGKIDLSGYLDKPAGKNGFLELTDGRFYTPDGNRFRIWGVNLTAGACFPDKGNAPKVARLFSSLGINAVRLHFLDSDWGKEKTIFRWDTNTTRVLDSEQLDKLDYFVYELKKAGVYTNFNLNVGRNYREGDDVPYHQYLGLAKAVTLFDDRLIELQKEYAAQLLKHKNPYTGNEYRNEPALAFLEIVNENSLTEAWMRGHLEGTHNSTNTSTWMDIPRYYAEELTMKYNNWLNNNFSDREIQRLREEAGVGKDELIPRLRNTEFSEASDFRFHTEARFIIETEHSFYTGMYEYLNDSLGVNQLVAANSDHSHYRSSYALLSLTSKLDFVDGHVYWQHPKTIRDSISGKKIRIIENTPMVNDPDWSTVVQLSRSAVEGMPYTVSETNHPYPNEFAAEGIITLGSYALLQDWDGIYFFTFEHNDPSKWKDNSLSPFDIMDDPVKLANLVAGSAMFHRKDIKSAEKTVLRTYTEQDLIEGIRSKPGSKPFFTPGFSHLIPLIYKTRIHSFSGSGQNDFPKIEKQHPIVSENGQLKWYYKNDKGLIVVDSDKTQALIGFSDKMKQKACQNLKVDIDNPFSSIVITSLDNRKIPFSKRLLLVATSRSILKGAKWNEERTKLIKEGNSPMTIDPVEGTVVLKNMINAKNLKIIPLNGAGMRLSKSFFPKKVSTGFEFEIGDPPTVWYLIEKQ